MGKPLTVELIVQKTKNDQLLTIRNLNLWGNGIDNLQVLRKLPNLEVLSLSVNKVTTLKYISCCPKLQELYLRKNRIQDIKELKYLTQLPNLRVLWLQDNPIAEHPEYRELVIKYLPKLIKLDNSCVAPEERMNYGDDYNSEDDIDIDKNFSGKKFSDKKSPIKQVKGSSLANSANQLQDYEARYNNQLQEYEARPTTPERDRERNENLLVAVLALIKEMDEKNLEIAKREIEKRLKKKDQ